MAQSNFDRCLQLVLKHEGGYVNHPKDPGGATNKGVIQRTYDSYRRSLGQASRSVRQITDAEVAAIYRRDYWGKVAGDALPLGLDYCTFDAGVNSGPSRGVKWLQKVVGVAQDGAAGPKTVAAAKAADARKAIVAFCAARMGFLRGLGHWTTFGKGWTRRVTEVEAKAVAMVLTTALSKASVPSELKAESSKAETAAKQQTAGAATSGTSGGATAATVDWTAWDSLAPWIVGGCVLGLAVLAVVLVRKAQINRARAEAYAAAAQEQAA